MGHHHNDSNKKRLGYGAVVFGWLTRDQTLPFVNGPEPRGKKEAIHSL